MRLKPILALLVAAVTTAAGVAALAATPAAPAGPAIGSTRIVFAARARVNGQVTGYQEIYTADGDGQNITRVTGDDGLFYNWPVWAMGGTKILFTARKGIPDGYDPTGEEDVFMMDPDGSHRIQLTRNLWRNAQPKLTPDGRTLIFASAAPEFFKFALYSMDLATLEVRNITVESGIEIGLDGDPKISADGTKLVFATASNVPQIGRIAVMNLDGTHRSEITHDLHPAFDPMASADGRYIVYSSYRGPGSPTAPDQSDPFSVRLWDFHLILLDTLTNRERVLTEGLKCVLNEPPDCTPTQASAFQPEWSPDGSQIGYISAPGPLRQGIYVVNPDGTNAHALIETATMSIFWWDWAKVGTAPPGAVERIGTAVSTERLLFGGHVYTSCNQLTCVPPPAEPQTPLQLFSSTRDRWNVDSVVPRLANVAGLQPDFARWSADRKQIVFTARLAYDTGAFNPAPAPPPGAKRSVHFTLLQLNPAAQGLVGPGPDAAQEQVFIMNADGTNARQLTTPWTEDYMDALPDGDARANRWPDLSPDGRYVVYTSTSAKSGESFVMRQDLQTGEVVSLTNVTAGAMPTADFHPRFSPDGSRIAIASTLGQGTEIFVMNSDGTNIRQVTDDGFINFGPAWSPDGRQLVYTSYRGTQSLFEVNVPGSPGSPSPLPLDHWTLVKLDLGSGTQTLIGPANGKPAWSAVWSPDGTQIASASIGIEGQTDIFVENADGSGWRILQGTISTKETYLDWR